MCSGILFSKKCSDAAMAEGGKRAPWRRVGRRKADFQSGERWQARAMVPPAGPPCGVETYDDAAWLRRVRKTREKSRPLTGPEEL